MKPLRVLQVVGAMDRGGIETWLMHVLRHSDRREFQIDFMVHTDQPAAYDAEVLDLGSKIFRCSHTQNPARYAKDFLKIARQSGPFDILHSHVHCFSGYTLALGRIAGIPMRIAHSHNDTRVLNSRHASLRNAYTRASHRLISANCTHGVAASEPAGEDLFGPNWLNDDRFRVLYCGIDLTPFENVLPDARAEFGFAERDPVFGHVGRFSPQKNHSFSIDMAVEIAKLLPRAKFLFVGDGPLRPELENRARLLGLRDSVVFAGLRSDIPRLMTSVMDVFLLPSLHEGLPLVIMEAQAAGLPCVVSEGTPHEAIVNPELVRRLPLSVGVREWARIACETASRPRFDRCRALDMLATSRFSISHSVHHLRDVYLHAAPHCLSPNLVRCNSVGGNRK